MVFVILLIISFVTRKRGKKGLSACIFSLAIIIWFGPFLLKRQIFGTWNAISFLGDAPVTRIVLRPSVPNWEVNLTGHDFSIVDKPQIDSLIHLLQKVEVYFPGHPMRIWETRMIITTAQKDSLEIKIRSTKNNGTDIYTGRNEWRKDSLGSYLEEITSYDHPVYADTATVKY